MNLLDLIIAPTSETTNMQETQEFLNTRDAQSLLFVPILVPIIALVIGGIILAIVLVLKSKKKKALAEVNGNIEEKDK